SSERTTEVLAELSQVLRDEFPEIKTVTEISGMNVLNRAFKSSGGSFFVQLKKWDERERTAEEVVNAVRGRLAGYQKASILAVTPPAVPGLGMSGGFNIQLIDLKSNDIKEFEAMAGQFLAAVNQ